MCWTSENLKNIIVMIILLGLFMTSPVDRKMPFSFWVLDTTELYCLMGRTVFTLLFAMVSNNPAV